MRRLVRARPRVLHIIVTRNMDSAAAATTLIYCILLLLFSSARARTVVLWYTRIRAIHTRKRKSSDNNKNVRRRPVHIYSRRRAFFLDRFNATRLIAAGPSILYRWISRSGGGPFALVLPTTTARVTEIAPPGERRGRVRFYNIISRVLLR